MEPDKWKPLERNIVNPKVWNVLALSLYGAANAIVLAVGVYAVLIQLVADDEGVTVSQAETTHGFDMAITAMLFTIMVAVLVYSQWQRRRIPE